MHTGLKKLYQSACIFFSKRIPRKEILDIIEYLSCHLQLFTHTESHLTLPIPTKNIHINPTIDIIISVGGDGTFLYAANIAIQIQKPILSIHKGTVGFLSTIELEKMKKEINQILCDANYFEKQSRYALWLNKKHIAINEVLCINYHNLAYFKVYVNHQISHQMHASGFLISTATGSTAYALSNGGPLIHPNVPSLLMMGVHNHSLKERPIILPKDVHIHIKWQSRSIVKVILDGKSYPTHGTDIHIHPYPNPLIHFMNAKETYFDILKKKIQW